MNIHSRESCRRKKAESNKFSTLRKERIFGSMGGLSKGGIIVGVGGKYYSSSIEVFYVDLY